MEVISRRGHQITAIHDSCNDCLTEEQNLVLEEVVEDIVENLPEIPAIWDDDVAVWYEYGEDFGPSVPIL